MWKIVLLVLCIFKSSYEYISNNFRLSMGLPCLLLTTTYVYQHFFISHIFFLTAIKVLLGVRALLGNYR